MTCRLPLSFGRAESAQACGNLSISRLRLEAIAVGRVFRAVTRGCCPKNPDQRRALNQPSSEGGVRVVGFCFWGLVISIRSREWNRGLVMTCGGQGC